MATPQGLGWGDQVTSEVVARANCTTIEHGGRAFVVNRHVAHLFLGFLRELTATGYDYSTGTLDDWSFAYRTIRGSTGLSMHAGFAIDLDALKNPLGSTATSFPAGIKEMARRWGLLWGGEFQTRPDPMHFEVRLTPAQVQDFRPSEVDDLYDAKAEERLFERIEAAERRTARYVDHGAVEQAGTGNHHVKIREDLSELARLIGMVMDRLAALEAAVGEIQTGLPSGEVAVTGTGVVRFGTGT